MRPRAIPLALFVLLWGAACDEDPPPDPCVARIAQLRERLSQRRSVRDPDTAPPDVALPRVDLTQPAPGLPLLVVSEGEVRFDGRGAGGADAESTIGALLQDLRLHVDFAGGEEPVDVGLWVEPTVTLQTLQRLVGHAPPRIRFVLLARGPVDPVGDMPGWLAAELNRVDPPTEGEGEGFPAVSVVPPEVQRRQRLPAVWTRATESCEAARPSLRFDARGTLLSASVTALVSATETCGCETADVPAIESVALEALRSPEGPLVRVPPPLRFGPGNGIELELAASMTVEALVRQLAARSDEMVFVRAE